MLRYVIIQNWGHPAQLDYSSVTRPSLPREGLACETSNVHDTIVGVCCFQVNENELCRGFCTLVLLASLISLEKVFIASELT